MNQENTFSYRYSAKENKEIQEIRRKYLPRSESKLEELKRLDGLVQSSGIPESLCSGIGGTIVFGFGFCLTTQLIGSGMWLMIIGAMLGIVGVAGMVAAYPIYRICFRSAKAKYQPRILELVAELSNAAN